MALKNYYWLLARVAIMFRHAQMQFLQFFFPIFSFFLTMHQITSTYIHACGSQKFFVYIQFLLVKNEFLSDESQRKISKNQL